MNRLACLSVLLMSVVCSLKAATLVDPTRPIGMLPLLKNSPEKMVQTLQLNAVFININNKYAIINGKQYQEGQEIETNRLLAIHQDRVILQSASGNKTLFINNHNIKKDVNNGF